MKGIVAMSRDRGIGYKGDLPWARIKEDMQWFRKCTLGNNVVFGSSTFFSIPVNILSKMKKDRNVFVLTRHVRFPIEGVTFVNNAEDLPEDCWVCGGAQIYELLMPKIKMFYVTHVAGYYRTDTFMPKFEKEFPLMDSVKEGEDFSIFSYEKGVSQ